MTAISRPDLHAPLLHRRFRIMFVADDHKTPISGTESLSRQIVNTSDYEDDPESMGSPAWFWVCCDDDCDNLAIRGVQALRAYKSSMFIRMDLLDANENIIRSVILHNAKMHAAVFSGGDYTNNFGALQFTLNFTYTNVSMIMPRG